MKLSSLIEACCDLLEILDKFLIRCRNLKGLMLFISERDANSHGSIYSSIYNLYENVGLPDIAHLELMNSINISFLIQIDRINTSILFLHGTPYKMDLFKEGLCNTEHNNYVVPNT